MCNIEYFVISGFSTPSPIPQSRKKKSTTVHATPDSSGRPKVPQILDYLDLPDAVWCTTDHDYIKTKCDPNSEEDCEKSQESVPVILATC